MTREKKDLNWSDSKTQNRFVGTCLWIRARVFGVRETYPQEKFQHADMGGFFERMTSRVVIL